MHATPPAREKLWRQNQIRLMIGGAIGEARGDLMPGFVEAALKTPFKLRVPLAPAEGLVLESQVGDICLLPELSSLVRTQLRVEWVRGS